MEVTSLRAGSVIPEFLLFFVNDKAENGSSSSLVQKIITETLIDTKAYFLINASSVQLSEISVSDAMNLLNGDTAPTPSIYTVSSTIQASQQNYSECGIKASSLSSKIVGGTDALLGAWPWQASLLLNGRHYCGASLISHNWLVSAAHCFDSSINVNLWTVALGRIHLNSEPGFKIQEIRIHENYERTTHANDISLLKLSTLVKFTEYIRPVCLPETSDVFPDDTSCYVTGWGRTTENGQFATTLKQAEVLIINATVCASPSMNSDFKIGPSMICAGYAAGKVDSCEGDSGGPLVAAKSNEAWYLVGITSFGDGCAKVNKPGVYSRLTYLRSWINDNCGL
uniref:Peptidase S1 domain-containing protein n=1 Tax=Leptobrachium leishanense TaxID=445787 RepID=A0A8C5M5J7_9ANUR